MRRKVPGWEQFNFEWKTSLRKEAEREAEAVGARTMAEFIRGAVMERIKRLKEERAGEAERAKGGKSGVPPSRE